MKILYISSQGDYLSDGLLHGLKKLYNSSVVDYPKSELIYDTCPELIRRQQRGGGFTLHTDPCIDSYGEDRFLPYEKIKSGFYDLVIFSDIYRNYGYFIQFRPWLDPKKTLIMDGADQDLPYPAAGMWRKCFHYWFLPVAHKDFLYFKREWTLGTRFTLPGYIVSRFKSIDFFKSKNLRKISFAIPEAKIIKSLPLKTKDFPKHIVDEEIMLRVDGAVSSYAFTSESEYYSDIQSARFGVTTKRAGWDCLRHYEIAANGAVPCFRNLDLKPDTCAPHGLNSQNSISYKSADELFSKINSLSPDQYLALQRGALSWVKEHTTVELAKYVITEWMRAE